MQKVIDYINDKRSEQGKEPITATVKGLTKDFLLDYVFTGGEATACRYNRIATDLYKMLGNKANSTINLLTLYYIFEV